MDCHEFANANSRNDNECDIILDFFAGSGTTAHAVMELNRADNGNRKCILVTNNEITDINPNGIAIDVTTKRLKRVMSGECYDGNKDFAWLKKNAPYGDNLAVYQIAKISKYAQGEVCHTEGEARSISNNDNRDISPTAQYDKEKEIQYGNPLDLIDEKLYGLSEFTNKHEKAKWLYDNFKACVKECESDEAYKNRHPKNLKGGEND
mgnify:CR=1 FL=1